MDIKLVCNNIRVTVLDGPYQENGKPIAQAVEYYTQLCASIDRFREFAAQKMLNGYNLHWADEQEDAPVLDHQGFIANLINPGIILMDELGCAVIHFADSNMFGGHFIEIGVRLGEPTDANMVG